MSHEPIIKQFVIEEFAPDVRAHELDRDHDLLDGGVIDSLGLLKLIAWLEATFDVVVEDDALDPENFRTVSAIEAFVERATTVVVVKAEVS